MRTVPLLLLLDRAVALGSLRLVRLAQGLRCLLLLDLLLLLDQMVKAFIVDQWRCVLRLLLGYLAKFFAVFT